MTTPAGIPAFLAEAKVSLPVLLDPEAKVAEAMHIMLTDPKVKVILVNVDDLRKAGEVATGKGPDGIAFVPGWKR